MRHFISVIVYLLLALILSACSEEPVITGVNTGALKTLEIGQTSPDFVLPLLSTPNKTVKLSDYKGKVVYVDFWASWCSPCKKSMPLLNELRKELSTAQFEVLAINVDENLENAQEFLSLIPVDYPILSNLHADLDEVYKVRGLPSAYLVDKEGVLRHIHLGFKARDFALLRRKIESMISVH